MQRDATFRAKIDQSWKSRKENPWLNGLDLDQDDLELIQAVQNTYVVQLDEHPDTGYAFRIWLLWDYDRLWGRFDFGHTKGVFLVDPGVNPSMCDEDDGQELPLTWRGVPKDNPNIFLCNELITKGKIRINPWMRTVEGFFEWMTGNGSAGERFKGDKCAFHAKPHFGPLVVPYTLEETVELWNYYLPFPVKEATVRQFLPLLELAADLRRRDGGTLATTDSEGEDRDAGNVASTDEEEEDDSSLVSLESLNSHESLIEVFDNSGRSILVRFQVREGKVLSGSFNGEFRDVFQEPGTN